jgi:hypothetical protein
VFLGLIPGTVTFHDLDRLLTENVVCTSLL